MTKLRQGMFGDMRVRNLFDNIQQAYLQQVGAYARYFHRSPDALGPDAVRAHQIHLTDQR